jgi:2-keto-4-pentenoate hydratase
MMNGDRIERAAKLLSDARRQSQGLVALPEDCRPTSPEEAYLIQDAIVRRLGPIGGWKVGAPGPNEPASFAPIFTGMIVRSPTRLPAVEHRLFGIEGEIAFRFGRALPERARPYEREEVLDAVASLHPVIEVVESRFSDFRAVDRLSQLADFASNGALVYGPAVAKDRPRFDLARPPVRIMIDGTVVAEGTGNQGGDPVRLLVELVNHVGKRTGGLAANAIVTTGSCTGMVFAHPGGRVVADFGDFGRVEVSFPTV